MDSTDENRIGLFTKADAVWSMLVVGLLIGCFTITRPKPVHDFLWHAIGGGREHLYASFDHLEPCCDLALWIGLATALICLGPTLRIFHSEKKKSSKKVMILATGASFSLAMSVFVYAVLHAIAIHNLGGIPRCL